MKKIYAIIALFVICLSCISWDEYSYGSHSSSTDTISVTSIIIGIIGLISLITFFVMAKALANISNEIRNTNRIVSAWSKETGIGYSKPVEKQIEENQKYFDLKYQTKKGDLIIRSSLESGFKNGYNAYIGNEPAPDGKYTLGFMWSINIKDGKVEFQ